MRVDLDNLVDLKRSSLGSGRLF